MSISDKILVGKVYDAHGIRGLVKIKAFTENPLSICNYSPLTDENGNSYKIQLKNAFKADIIIVQINDISNRTDAEKLKGTKLYASRDIIVDNDEEVLLSELENFKVIDEQETLLGIIVGTFNHGAGEVLEIELTNGKTGLLSMNKDSVLEINKQKEYIKIDYEHLLES